MECILRDVRSLGGSSSLPPPTCPISMPTKMKRKQQEAPPPWPLGHSRLVVWGLDTIENQQGVSDTAGYKSTWNAASKAFPTRVKKDYGVLFDPAIGQAVITFPTSDIRDHAISRFPGVIRGKVVTLAKFEEFEHIGTIRIYAKDVLPARISEILNLPLRPWVLVGMIGAVSVAWSIWKHHFN
ncbi:hypothetical protein HDU88_008727 [Geranomyces variabilis]|nr:hypothetical protein HDU88_008727 [Geranomyces variabilis]